MCTSPISIYRQFKDGSSKEYLVPCGKCAECRSSYQSEFSLKVLLAAEQANSLHFFTLTYNSDSLPLAISQPESIQAPEDVDFPTDDPVITKNTIVGFVRGRYEHFHDGSHVDFDKRCRPFGDVFGYNICPSLYREDVKNWFKRFRSYCTRQKLKVSFSYAGFGEYGEARYRPHYHVLVAGLDDSQARTLCRLWDFGYSCLKPIPRFNKDGSDAFQLTSKYVSKYICKRSRLPWFVKDGFSEAPRCQSSVGFGKNLDIDKLRPFLSRGGLRPIEPSSPLSGNH